MEIYAPRSCFGLQTMMQNMVKYWGVHVTWVKKTKQKKHTHETDWFKVLKWYLWSVYILSISHMENVCHTGTYVAHLPSLQIGVYFTACGFYRILVCHTLKIEVWPNAQTYAKHIPLRLCPCLLCDDSISLSIPHIQGPNTSNHLNPCLLKYQFLRLSPISRIYITQKTFNATSYFISNVKKKFPINSHFFII